MRAVPRDGFGREIDYLRISLTDHCNLRCVYCMPLAGNHYAPSPDLLTAAEIEAVARAAVAVGFRKFRLTGGEPTLRADLVEIVERLAGVAGVRDLAMTTNGVRLSGLASRLAAAGLKRINVHLDSLDADRLARVMRWGTLAEIWAGIEAAEAAGLRPIKLNAVVVRRFNEEDVVRLAALTLERDWYVRFIETMPLGRGAVAAVARAGVPRSCPLPSASIPSPPCARTSGRPSRGSRLEPPTSSARGPTARCSSCGSRGTPRACSPCSASPPVSTAASIRRSTRASGTSCATNGRST